MKIATFALGTLLASSLGLAQTPPSQPAPDKQKTVNLSAGTEVPLAMAQDVSSRGTKPGEPVELTLARDLKINRVLVAKAGARALGEVVQAKKPDFWGDPGEISIRVKFLRVGDKKVELHGSASNTGNVYVVIRGSQGIIKTGTPVSAFIATDTEVLPLPAPSQK
jgi:hypothetical protein